MNLTVKTKYDYNRIIDFNISHHTRSKFIWICMGIILFCASFVFFSKLSRGALDQMGWITFIAALVFVLSYSFLVFVYPRFTIKKSYLYDQEESMTFTEENIKFTSQCKGASSSGTVEYSTIVRVTKTKMSYILYVTAITAYLVDREGIAGQIDESEFDAFLIRMLGKDKIKFKV